MADNQSLFRFSIFLFQRIRQTGTRGKKELIASQVLTWIALLPSWIASSTLIGNVRSSIAASLTPYKLPLAHVDTMKRPFAGLIDVSVVYIRPPPLFYNKVSSTTYNISLRACKWMHPWRYALGWIFILFFIWLSKSKVRLIYTFFVPCLTTFPTSLLFIAPISSILDNDVSIQCCRGQSRSSWQVLNRPCRNVGVTVVWVNDLEFGRLCFLYLTFFHLDFWTQASAAFPENTIASFDRAIRDGSEGLESG